MCAQLGAQGQHTASCCTVLLTCRDSANALSLRLLPALPARQDCADARRLSLLCTMLTRHAPGEVCPEAGDVVGMLKTAHVVLKVSSPRLQPPNRAVPALLGQSPRLQA